MYTFVWNLAIAINYILPWAATIEPMVAVEKRQIYSDAFGPFIMKGDGWPNSPNGISETRSVCYSAERSSRQCIHQIRLAAQHRV